MKSGDLLVAKYKASKSLEGMDYLKLIAKFNPLYWYFYGKENKG